MIKYEEAKERIYKYLMNNIESIQEDNPVYKKYKLDWWEDETIEFERGWIMSYGPGEPLPETPIPTETVHSTGGIVLIVDKFIPQCIEMWDRASAKSLIKDYMATYENGLEAFQELAYYGETAHILPIKW